MNRRDTPPDGWVLLTIGVLGLAVTALASAIAVVEAPAERWLPAAVLRGALVAAPVSVALIALRVRATDRFAWCLLGTTALFSLTALAESRNPELYAIGRNAVWFSELMLAFLLLSFPSGQLSARADRLIVGTLAVAVLLLYLPATLIDHEYPTPSPWSTCDDDCPSNVFALTNSTPAFFHDVVLPLRELLTVAVMLAVVVVLVRRAQRGGPLLRRALQPIAMIAVLRVVALVVYFLARARSDVSTVVQGLGWVWAFTLPALSLSFGAGLLARRLHAASSLQELALQSHTDLGQARETMAKALEDPSVRLVYRTDKTGVEWIDDTGTATPRPQNVPGRRLTEVGTQKGEHALVVLHDAAAGQDPMVVRTAASYALVAIENSSLMNQLRASIDRLADSRARLIDSTDSVRRSIERDLHDGGQQRLTALRIRLAIAAEKLEGVSPEDAERLRGLGEEVDQAIDEIRRLARGIYPAVLADQGLEPALRATARMSPILVSVDVDGIERMRAPLERTVYFVCTEAMQNAVKHADGASRIDVRVHCTDSYVHFEVADDGQGFDLGQGADGSGLPNLADRVAASGGTVRVESCERSGTTVTGTIPIA